MSVEDEVGYCTREQVQAALDQAESVRLNRRIDEAVRAGRRAVEAYLHRRFYPITGTRYPPARWVDGRILWLNHQDYEIISLSSLTIAGTALVAGVDYFLAPDLTGPPYTSIRLFAGAAQAWPVDDERGLALVGQFGASGAGEAVGTLAANISSSSATTMTVSDSSLVGVCDLLLLGAERLVVVEKDLVDTTATVAGAVDADMADTSIPVSSGALVKKGETILVGAERMYVEQIAGNTLIVRRAEQGSTLAAHASPDIVYAPRLCTVRRGAAGTTAGTHTAGAALTRNRAPSVVAEASLAYALNYLEQAKSAYARTVGEGDSAREAGGRGVKAALEDAYVAFGRQGRIGAA